MNLAEFLLARIAEDEVTARAAVSGPWVRGDDLFGISVRAAHDTPVAYETGILNAEHIAAWDPARVLAKCEADRRIVETVQGPLTEIVWTAIGCSETTDPGDTRVGEQILACLALPYADHPDFDESWRS